MKQIFTKTQAVSLLVQIKAGKKVGLPESLLVAVEANHNLFRHSCEELEKKLLEYVDSELMAGVCDDPVIKEKAA